MASEVLKSEETELLNKSEGEVEATVTAAAMNALESPEMHNMARRKLMNSSIAKQRFKRAVLEAAHDLSSEFHGPYLSRLLMSDLSRGLLDANHPASTFDTVKKGFLFHMNSTGHYLVIREHLRHAITHVIQQCGLVLRPSGFKNHREFQSFLHDMYIFLADELHEALNESTSSEIRSSSSSGPKFLARSTSDESIVCLRKLHHFSEEAFTERDYENCHRFHLLRICHHNELPELWTDFAIMWCARGDDRMAEIALREALKLDPKYVHALLLAGIIAARNKDERAIGFIGQALKLYPLSPEIMVLLAVAHRKLGNEARSKYFFLKARLLHLMLTGKDTSKAEADFSSFQFPDTSPQNEDQHGLNHVPGSLEKNAEKIEDWQKKSSSGRDKRKRSRSTSSKARTNEESDRKVKGEQPVPPNTTKTMTETPRDGGDGSVKSGKSRRKSKLKAGSDSGENSKDGKSQKSDDETKSQKSDKKKRNKKSPPQTTKPDPITEMVQDDNSPLFAQRTSIAANNALPPRSNSAAKLAYDFPIEITDENSNLIHLPALVFSIVFTWDVTQPYHTSDVEQAIPKSSIHFESNLRSIGSVAAGNRGLEDEVTQSYEKFVASKLNTPAGSAVRVESGRRSKSPNRKKDTTTTTSTKSTSEGVKGGKTPRSGKKSFKNTSGGSNDDMSQASQVLQILPPPTEQQKPENLEEEPELTQKDRKSLVPSLRKVWTRRFGSEYIWAAQLFLRYHAHDFLDAVLARELFYSDNRSVPFSYMLAHSMNLRKREKAAKVLIEELMSKQEFKQNAYIWEQKGHAHYGLSEMDLAAQCYEKAIEYAEPNQNLQVAYLRYGNLNMDNSRLAKSVLLKGTGLFPSLYLWIALGKLCYQTGQFSEAEAAFTHANRMDNTNPSTWGYLALVNLAQENQTLAEQCYKWAVRFGLKSGPILEEIRALQQKLGFGDPSFPRVPNSIPHQYYLKRLGRQNLLEVYREALEAPDTYFGNRSVLRLEETAREAELKRLLQQLHTSQMTQNREATEEEEGTDEYEDETNPNSSRSGKADLNLPKRPSQLFKSSSKSPKRKGTLTKSKSKTKKGVKI